MFLVFLISFCEEKRPAEIQNVLIHQRCQQHKYEPVPSRSVGWVFMREGNLRGLFHTQIVWMMSCVLYNIQERDVYPANILHALQRSLKWSILCAPLSYACNNHWCTSATSGCNHDESGDLTTWWQDHKFLINKELAQGIFFVCAFRLCNTFVPNLGSFHRAIVASSRQSARPTLPSGCVPGGCVSSTTGLRLRVNYSSRSCVRLLSLHHWN